jgi:predicted nucleic acid-binding protein
MSPQPLALDASVAVKLAIDEEYSEQALALLNDSWRGRRPLIAPVHLPGEVTNAIYQRWRSTDPTKHLDDAEAVAALGYFLAIRIELLTIPDAYGRAFDFARAHAISSIYDSLYVVLAQQFGVELWTADARLLAECGSAAPWVRFIRDYPL